MGFSKETVSRIVVSLSYLQADPTTGETIRDEQGNATHNKCVFAFRRRTNGEAKEAARDAVAGSAPASVVDRVAALLIEAPTGFDDFPMDDRPLAERVREYFNDPDLLPFLDHALTAYMTRALPAELFRGF